jgi:hypothetical protein
VVELDSRRARQRAANLRAALAFLRLPPTEAELQVLHRYRGWLISRTPPRCATLSAVSLLTGLDAFFTDHRPCGELEAGVDGRGG